jgi:hypothetical protein
LARVVISLTTLTERSIDENYCGGTVASPQPTGNKFGGLTFSQGDATCNIRDWIHGLDPESEDQDALSKFDEKVNDGSIGKLGTKEEKMFNSQRFVPLFEFRDLLNVYTKTREEVMGMADFMSEVDKAIQVLHNNFANAPESPSSGTPGPEPSVAPQPSEEPEHRQPTKTMQVFWSEVSDGVSPLAWYWQIYLGEAGKGVDPCEASPINNIYDFSAPSGKNFWNDAPTTVSGQWDIKVDGIDCVFFGDRLECPGANNMLSIPCTADSRPFDDCASLGMPSKAIVHCDW